MPAELALAAWSDDGSVPSAMRSAASAGEAPAASAASAADALSGVPPMFVSADRGTAHRAVVAANDRGDADRRPVLRPPV